MNKKITLRHFGFCLLLALSCLTWTKSNAQVTCTLSTECQTTLPTAPGDPFMVQGVTMANMQFTTIPQTGCVTINYLTDTAKICLGEVDSMFVNMSLPGNDTTHTLSGIGVFIDTNQNGFFSANEFQYGNLDTTGFGYGFPINIVPPRAGIYKVRILDEAFANFTPADTCHTWQSFGNYIEFYIEVLDTAKITTQPLAVDGCVNNAVTFSVVSPGIGVTYQWYRDTTLIKGAAASHATYTIPIFEPTDTDTYFVIVGNKCSLLSSDTVALTIHPKPPITVAPLGPTIFCPGFTVILQGGLDTGIYAGLQHIWLRNGSLLRDTSNADTVTLPGDYTYIVSNGCTDTAAAITVQNYPTSVPHISPPGLNKVCNPTQVVFTTAAGPVGGVRYQWQINTGVPNVYVNIPTDTSTYFTASQTAFYKLVLTDSNGCVTQSLPSTLQENSPATVNLTTTSSQYLCAGSYITLAASSSDTGEKFTWQFNGTAIRPAATDVTYQAFQPGNYSVIGNNGCSVTSASFTIMGIPAPSVIVAGPTTFCGGGSVLLSSSVTDTNFTYQWQKNNVDIPGATGTTYQAQDSGEYTIVLISHNTCTAGSTAVGVIVHPIPVPVISLGTDNLTLTVSPSFHSYQWYRNDTIIAAPLGTMASYVAHIPGKYTVTVVDDDTCSGTSAILTAPGDNNVGVSMVNAQSISVYPNPATATVRIAAPVVVNAAVMSVDGRIVLTKAAATEINIQQLADGVYTLRITDENGNTLKIEKLVKASQ